MAGSESRLLPFRLDSPLGALRPLDLLVIGYASLSGLVLAWGVARGFPRCASQLVFNAAVVAGALALARFTREARHPFAVFLRLAYAPILFSFLYRQIEVIWPLFHAGPFDAGIAGLDQWLFGMQPSLRLQSASPSRALGELFCFSYYAYYYYTPAVLFTALFTRGYAAAERVVFSVSLCFFSFYVLFFLYPTVGPHFYFPPYDGPRLYPGYAFNHLLFFFTEQGEIRGGAFPSSHVAVATLLTLLARREAARLFPWMAGITLLMCPAVVYLRAHYVVDVPAGVLIGLGFYPLGERVRCRLERWLHDRRGTRAPRAAP